MLLISYAWAGIW